MGGLKLRAFGRTIRLAALLHLVPAMHPRSEEEPKNDSIGNPAIDDEYRNARR